LASLFLAVLGCAIFWRLARTIPLIQQNVLTFWNRPPDLKSALQHVAFLGNFDTDRYNPPCWSLVFEMRISLIFPFVCLALKRMNAWTAILAAATVSLGATMIIMAHADWINACDTLHYLSFFVIGALLARRLQREPWPAIPDAVRHAMIPLSILVFSYAGTLGRLHHYLGFATTADSTQSMIMQHIIDWMVAAGSLGMIYLSATHPPVKRTLSRFTLRFLGHISFSIYLVHFVVLTVLMSLLYKRLPMAMIFPIYIVIALIAATVFNRLVEAPATRMGQRLTPKQADRRAHDLRFTSDR
jgi:peptidoglycan/LPS O-acetylase OafA/YrhL